MTIKPKFKFKQPVFFINDVNKDLCWVVSYTVLFTGEILYNCSSPDGMMSAYDFEIEDYESRIP